MNKILSNSELSATDLKTRNNYLKKLFNIASNSPENLYQDLEKISEYFESENKIIKSAGIELVGYLSSVDTEDKIENYIKPLIKYIHSGQLNLSKSAISALALIAQNKTKFRNKIIKEFLKIENDRFNTEYSKSILIRKILEEFKELLPMIKYDERVVDFIMLAKSNNNPSTKKKAEELLVHLTLI